MSPLDFNDEYFCDQMFLTMKKSFLQPFYQSEDEKNDIEEEEKEGMVSKR
jgi:hypothetical protein